MGEYTEQQALAGCLESLDSTNAAIEAIVGRCTSGRESGEHLPGLLEHASYLRDEARRRSGLIAKMSAAK